MGRRPGSAVSASDEAALVTCTPAEVLPEGAAFEAAVALADAADTGALDPVVGAEKVGGGPAGLILLSCC